MTRGHLGADFPARPDPRLRAARGLARLGAIEAYLPQSERLDLIAEIRSLTQGLGAFEAAFDHMAELTGRLAEEITAKAHAQGHRAEVSH